jgi:hypothetical protein
LVGGVQDISASPVILVYTTLTVVGGSGIVAGVVVPRGIEDPEPGGPFAKTNGIYCLPFTAASIVVEIFELTVLVIFVGIPKPTAVKLLTGPPLVAGVHDIVKILGPPIPIILVGGSGRVDIYMYIAL